MAYEAHGARVVDESKDAIRVSFDGQAPVWVPKSVVDDDSEVWSLKNGGPGTLAVTLAVHDWWAEKTGKLP